MTVMMTFEKTIQLFRLVCSCRAGPVSLAWWQDIFPTWRGISCFPQPRPWFMIYRNSQLHVHKYCWLKGIVSDSNKVSLWHKPEDNKSRLFPKFQLISVLRLQIMHDYLCYKLWMVNEWICAPNFCHIECFFTLFWEKLWKRHPNVVLWVR